jgi:hypothetical protein
MIVDRLTVCQGGMAFPFEAIAGDQNDEDTSALPWFDPSPMF